MSLGLLQMPKRIVFVPLLVALMAAACTAILRPPQPYGMRLPSTAVLGPEFSVFDQAAGIVTTAVDGNDRVHLLIAASGSSDLYHAVIGPAGSEELETVVNPAPSSPIVAAFDSDGDLHAVFGPEYFVLHDKVWSQRAKSLPCERLLYAGKTLICAYLAHDLKTGARWRIDYFSTPLSLGIPIPVPVRSRMLLLACWSSSDWVTWAQLDPAENRDVADYQVSGDDSGSVQVLYIWRRQIIATASGVDIARAPGMTDCGARTPENPIVEFSGKAMINNGGINSDLYDFAIAVDPHTGDSLSIAGAMELHTLQSFMRRGDSIDSPRPVEPDRRGLSTIHGPIRIAPAGRDRFHVLLNVRTTFHNDIVLFYMTYFNGEWSPPIEISRSTITSWSEANVKLISVGSRRALAVWPEDHQIRARWIEAAPSSGPEDLRE